MNTLAYRYAANGNRTGVTLNGNSYDFLWDGAEEYAEYDASTGTRIARFDHDPDDIDVILDQEQSAGPQYFLHDVVGTVSGAITPDGSLVTAGYDAFGEPTATPTIPLDWGYMGRHRDSAGSPVSFRNRYYDSHTGVFLSRDPARYAEVGSGLASIRADIATRASHIDEASRTDYSFVESNPLTRRDPFGLATISFGVQAQASVSAAIVTAQASASVMLNLGSSPDGVSFAASLTLAYPEGSPQFPT